MLAAMQPWFGYAAFGMVAASCLADNDRAIRLALLLFANWVVGTFVVGLLGVPDPALIFMALDFVTAWAVLGCPGLSKLGIAGLSSRPVGRVEGLIGVTYQIMIVTHAVYFFIDIPAAKVAYWRILAGLSWLQLAAVGGWLGLELARRYRPFAGLHRHDAFVPVDRQGVAE
jgi:uncharacterized membrane protein YsdA (DUF1294 family)